jgi:hypothetical protein
MVSLVRSYGYLALEKCELAKVSVPSRCAEVSVAIPFPLYSHVVVETSPAKPAYKFATEVGQCVDGPCELWVLSVWVFSLSVQVAPAVLLQAQPFDMRSPAHQCRPNPQSSSQQTLGGRVPARSAKLDVRPTYPSIHQPCVDVRSCGGPQLDRIDGLDYVVACLFALCLVPLFVFRTKS